MNQDTIPSQLGPITIPSPLGTSGSPSSSQKQSSGLNPAIKWVVGVAAVAVFWFLSR